MGTTGVFNRFKIFGNHVNRHKNEGKLLLKCYRSRYRLYIFNILVCELNCLGPRSESWMNCVVVRSQLGTDWSVSLSIVRLYAVKFFLFYEWPLIFIQNCTSVNKCFLSNIRTVPIFWKFRTLVTVHCLSSYLLIGTWKTSRALVSSILYYIYLDMN